MIPLLLLTLTPTADPAPWEKDEAVHLTNIKQVTTDFVRAGEGYFSPDGTKVIYQAEEKDTGNPFYQIFVQDLATGRRHRVSPGVGKTTCAYFRPDGKKVIFASTHEDPGAKEQYAAEYKQREEDRAKGVRRRYTWDFDAHMKIYEADPDGFAARAFPDLDLGDARLTRRFARVARAALEHPADPLPDKFHDPAGYAGCLRLLDG